ncbi:hypothetical protein JIP62_07015 [Brevundimonas vitis]|uniref:Phage protein n=1 Tax=Brevundimonas vitisensis TaxID=2800818 RepID=A0ABX7BUQ5_9CAUL|nr:hypothetical protein [Brevundimonas vitisensis]QQQ19829.1 hypothetical protein JIP62_07015 [Brevundimonas vitisensis]
MKDLHSHLSPIAALIPAVQSATATSSAIDLQGFNSAEVLIQTGAIASAGDFTVKLQHSDTATSGDFADTASTDRLGSFPASLAADSVYRVGYKGGKRYVRTVVTKNGGTSIIAGITVLRGHPADGPVA